MTAKTTKKKSAAESTTKQFGLRVTDVVSKMIADIARVEGHHSEAAAIVQCIRDRHQHLVEIGSITRNVGSSN